MKAQQPFVLLSYLTFILCHWSKTPPAPPSHPTTHTHTQNSTEQCIWICLKQIGWQWLITSFLWLITSMKITELKILEQFSGSSCFFFLCTLGQCQHIYYFHHWCAPKSLLQGFYCSNRRVLVLAPVHSNHWSKFIVQSQDTTLLCAENYRMQQATRTSVN